MYTDASKIENFGSLLNNPVGRTNIKLASFYDIANVYAQTVNGIK